MSENMFGKQRGRFDERVAFIAAAGLPDKFIATFCAMTDAQQDECMARFNALFAAPTWKHRKFRMETAP